MTKWCPDPACRAEIPDDAWQVEGYGGDPREEEVLEQYHWLAACPGCVRRISAWHDDRADVDPMEPDPATWCCPLCGWPAELRYQNRGPLGAHVVCEGCRAKATVSRKPMAELLRRTND